jgi:hypothetical protein
MKHLKLFEDFKVANITIDDIIECIKHGGVVYATIVKKLPNNDPKDPLKVVSVDEDGLITIEHEGNEYEINLKDVEKIEY